MGERGVLAASRNQTIREHLEWLRDNPWSRPEQIAEVAVAAIDQLADRDAQIQSALRMLGVDLAFVLSAGTHESARSSAKQAVRTVAQLEALLLVPDPGVGAEHAPKEHP